LPRRGWARQPGRPPARGTEEGMEPDDLLCSRNLKMGWRRNRDGLCARRVPTMKGME
jgi:hypothetical protein